MSYCVLTFVIINYDILFINSLQKGPEMYPGNAPFPLAFGIPNTEPLSYSTSGLTTMDISSKFLKYILDVHRIFSRKPIRNSEFHNFLTNANTNIKSSNFLVGQKSVKKLYSGLEIGFL